jgi:hypothetical protein
MLAPLWLIASYALARRAPAWSELRTLTAASVVAALPAAAVLAPYALQLRSMGFEKELADGLDLLAYANPARGNLLWGWVDFGARFDETEHFVGFLSLGLIALGVAAVRRVSGPTGVLAVLTACFGLVLSLGPQVRISGDALFAGPYWALYAFVPLARRADFRPRGPGRRHPHRNGSRRDPRAPPARDAAVRDRVARGAPAG